MIVKNEEANLRACIESSGDLATEVIIVDTGSTDSTVSVARDLGVQVYFHKWSSDFAAARNESIRHATGQWVFWLDADDRLSPEAVAQVKRAAASGVADAYNLLVYSHSSDGSVEMTEHARLFRNGLGVRFSGAIHEGVMTDLLRLGLRTARTDIVVQHTGYNSTEVKKQKGLRNLPIIEREIALHPDNPHLLFYRGQARGLIGDGEGGISDLTEYLSRTRPSKQFDLPRFWAYVSLISVRKVLGSSDQLQSLLTQALSEFPRHPGFLLTSAVRHIDEGHIAEALDELMTAHAALGGTVLGMRPPEVQLEARIADCLRALGRGDEALCWALQAKTHAPDSIEACTVLARLYLDKGRLDEAESILGSFPSDRGSADIWLVLADLRRLQGRQEDAIEAVKTAVLRGLPEARAQKFLAQLRAADVLAATQTQTPAQTSDSEPLVAGLALLARGEHLKAAEAFADAIERTPDNPDCYKYLSVALRKLGREEEALTAWQLALHYEQQTESKESGPNIPSHDSGSKSSLHPAPAIAAR